MTPYLLFQRFFRYHDHLYTQALEEKRKRDEANRPEDPMDPMRAYRGDDENSSPNYNIPYWTVFTQCFGQCFNVFFTFFVTLTIFPAVLAGTENIRIY